jgi:chromosome segregation ATPase
MLQKFGLVKYRKKFLIENNLNINPIYSPKAIKFTNYLYLSPRDNSNNPINQKLRSSLNNKNRIYPKKENTTKVDTLFRNNINRFISESTNIIENKNSPMYLVQINHNIDDINYEPKKLLTTFSPTKNTNNGGDTFKRKNQFNGILKYVKDDIEKKNDFKKKLYEEIQIKREINNKKEKIKRLNINNDSILNKIKLLEKEYQNYLKNSTEIDTNLNSNLNDAQNSKNYKNVIDDDLFYLKENIIELKNKISILDREQKSINLKLFKEKMENDLIKEDIEKMNKLIENIKQDNEETKKEISLIQNKNKKLLMDIKTDL